jgi:hypothetical protein
MRPYRHSKLMSVVTITFYQSKKTQLSESRVDYTFPLDNNRRFSLVNKSHTVINPFCNGRGSINVK